MCGIAGIIRFDGAQADQAALKRMNRFMLQRGPDGEGYWTEGPVGFAHRRLSIIDLSERGAQPMEDAGKRTVITYNGEIYNYRALRSELEKAGCTFITGTDTEVILNGYLHWGIHILLEKLEGMFAFVLYDKAARKAYACRDRFGKKPLYYYFVTGKEFTFSSDIRAVAEGRSLTLDTDSLDHYLTELSVPQPHTIWKEIKQVAAASCITIDIANSEVEESRYWKLDFSRKLDLSIDETEAELEKALTQAIMKRLVGDVTAGCFLSGGADSGLIVSLLATNSSERIKTFSVGFGYEEYNELPLARRLAERYNTDHTEIVVDSDIESLLPLLTDNFGEPFADSSNIPTYYISREISKSIKVALAGDGGDEMFGGYYEYGWAYNTDAHSRSYSSKTTRTIARMVNAVAYRAKLSSVNLGLVEHYAGMSGGERLHRQMGFSREDKEHLYSTSFANAGKQFAFTYLNSAWEEANKLSLTDNLFESSLSTRLLNDYLVKVDRASMMSSLEVRSPFLDHKLAEFAASIPNEYKLNNGTLKYLLKKLAVKYIDKDFFSRKKQGFSLPLNHWLRKELKPLVTEALFSGSLEGRKIFNMNFIKEVYDSHLQMKEDHTNRIWALVCLEYWFRKFC